MLIKNSKNQGIFIHYFVIIMNEQTSEQKERYLKWILLLSFYNIVLVILSFPHLFLPFNFPWAEQGMGLDGLLRLMISFLFAIASIIYIILFIIILIKFIKIIPIIKNLLLTPRYKIYIFIICLSMLWFPFLLFLQKNTLLYLFTLLIHPLLLI